MESVRGWLIRAMDGALRRGFDSEQDALACGADDLDFDATLGDDAFAGASCEDEHVLFPVDGLGRLTQPRAASDADTCRLIGLNVGTE